MLLRIEPRRSIVNFGQIPKKISDYRYFTSDFLKLYNATGSQTQKNLSSAIFKPVPRPFSEFVMCQGIITFEEKEKQELPGE